MLDMEVTMSEVVEFFVVDETFLSGHVHIWDRSPVSGAESEVPQMLHPELLWRTAIPKVSE